MWATPTSGTNTQPESYVRIHRERYDSWQNQALSHVIPKQNLGADQSLLRAD